MQLILSRYVARQMMKHCRYPSTRQYNVVAIKLIETYGMLKDCEGTCTVSVSTVAFTVNGIHESN